MYLVAGKERAIKFHHNASILAIAAADVAHLTTKKHQTVAFSQLPKTIS